MHSKCLCCLQCKTKIRMVTKEKQTHLLQGKLYHSFLNIKNNFMFILQFYCHQDIFQFYKQFHIREKVILIFLEIFVKIKLMLGDILKLINEYKIIFKVERYFDNIFKVHRYFNNNKIKSRNKFEILIINVVRFI